MNEKRELLTRLFDAAIAAASPYQALKPYFPASKPKGRTLVIGIGKASVAMARAFEQLWQEADFGSLEGIVVSRYGQDTPLQHLELIHASHPLPDENSLLAGRRICHSVAGLGRDDLLIALISGGGSALLTAPAAGLTLDDKIALNQSLLASGAPISVMNAIRARASCVKGGRLAQLAHPAKVISYILSDVPGDDPALVSSGPTVVPDAKNENVLSLIQHYNIALTTGLEAFFAQHERDAKTKSSLSASPAYRAECDSIESLICSNYLFSPQFLSENRYTLFGNCSSENFSADETYLIASARTALLAARDRARRENIDAVLFSDALEGEARDIATMHGGLAREIALYNQPFAKPVILLSGGETTVTLAGSGMSPGAVGSEGGSGGRNSEFALSLSLAIAGLDNVTALAADTDGIDGMSQSAGAFCDGNTVSRLRALGLDPLALLRRHDSAHAFAQLDDLFITGATGTNVNDFRAIFIT